jgi:hypothetical protein
VDEKNLSVEDEDYDEEVVRLKSEILRLQGVIMKTINELNELKRQIKDVT